MIYVKRILCILVLCITFNLWFSEIPINFIEIYYHFVNFSVQFIFVKRKLIVVFIPSTFLVVFVNKNCSHHIYIFNFFLRTRYFFEQKKQCRAKRAKNELLIFQYLFLFFFKFIRDILSLYNKYLYVFFFHAYRSCIFIIFIGGAIIVK